MKYKRKRRSRIIVLRGCLIKVRGDSHELEKAEADMLRDDWRHNRVD